MYDVIVVGARVAGSSTAMLLARRGLKVLVVDRASFPSDTLSTHQVQLPGIAKLRRWGLLERVAASGAPPTRHVVFDQGAVALDGHYPEFDGVDALYSPRRTVLDKLLVDAAREAGAEVREGFVVEELLADGGRVAGVRGREKGGVAAVERARLVVGADGKHSLVARTVGAATYHDKPVLSMACYTYWEGVDLAGGEIHGRGRRAGPRRQAGGALPHQPRPAQPLPHAARARVGARRRRRAGQGPDHRPGHRRRLPRRRAAGRGGGGQPRREARGGAAGHRSRRGRPRRAAAGD